MSTHLIIASPDERFRDNIRENLLNQPNAKLVAEYADIAPNLYIRVLQDLERNPEAALIMDLGSDPASGLKTLEKMKQAAPDLYIIAADYSEAGEAIVQTIRAGANDYLILPLRRSDFREAMNRLERTPRRASSSGSRLGKLYTFLGTKGGVGTTTLAVNFASVLAQRKQQAVLLDLDINGNDVAMQLGAQPQYTLYEVSENLGRMDQALFEGFVTRDPLGFLVVGPPDALGAHTLQEGFFRDFATFLVEKYESIVIDAGRDMTSELVLGALQASSSIFLVLTQEFPSIRNAQRYMAYLMRLGFNQDQIRIVINQYAKRNSPNYASLEQIQQTLNQPVFYGIPTTPAVLTSINKARPLVTDRQIAPEFDKAFRAFVDKATGKQKAVAKSA
ncbi:MAG TPA: P-loop NTPase [Bryobacteraceae bacterium]|nr:P-loop NTPase [Bryobacteraceae bacterium]